MKTKKPIKQLPYPKKINTIGDHIKKRRLDLQLLQKDVATHIGVDETTVCYWENNKFDPKIRYMPAIFDFLGYCPFTSSQTFSEKLITMRQGLGLTREQLAKKLNIDVSTLASWERGKRNPTKKSLEKIQTFFKRGSL